MAQITLRQANVIPSTGGTVKGTQLTNAEIDNNFANLNVVANNLEANVGELSSLTTTEQSNVVFAINEVKASIVDPIPFAIALG